ncbi:uncharacterized protein BO72DRAFT_497590 [Aspergillus fijiensis CBS 313.89]|uniref:Xylanolytic transcriptional activator regulatory domain-containing protein n=1 Tax=Aspergillus fijiensis CBS 313.89 TaxID=1448319 RepID=A0A8G1RSE1_9EURO|nr:uncharacterized protein BO72DRAFT_497590 [Aspergillus fijiensis CBS 313.89]RAK75861.1 hypothetical protein BO72DRAFT_497590 [Aspergillus fijiensis CBS 313.89]
MSGSTIPTGSLPRPGHPRPAATAMHAKNAVMAAVPVLDVRDEGRAAHRRSCGVSRRRIPVDRHEYINIYFNKFHPIWPFLHRTTFYPAKEPCILLQSMLMMGLWIKGDREARHTAMRFHDRLLSAIRAQKDQWHVPESMGHPDDSRPWPMATYQSILLQLIFAVLTAKPEVQVDLNCRFRLPEPTYELLTALVAICRRLGLFSYPNMLARHHSTAPVALVWVSVEEIKRFGLALYKLCRLCSSSTSSSRANTDSGADELLTLADLDFSMPDSDDWWNVASTTDASTLRHTGWHSTARDNRNPGGWISQASAHLPPPPTPPGLPAQLAPHRSNDIEQAQIRISAHYDTSNVLSSYFLSPDMDYYREAVEQVLHVMANTSDCLAQYNFVVAETSFRLQLLSTFSLTAARTPGSEVSDESLPYVEV